MESSKWWMDVYMNGTFGPIEVEPVKQPKVMSKEEFDILTELQRTRKANEINWFMVLFVSFVNIIISTTALCIAAG